MCAMSAMSASVFSKEIGESKDSQICTWAGFSKRRRNSSWYILRNLEISANDSKQVQMDKSWITKPRLSEAYTNGVKSFLDFAFGRVRVDMLKCPCNRCSLSKTKFRKDIEGDLMCFGFLSSYTEWVLHGEEVSVTQNPPEVLGGVNTPPIELDSTAALLDDLFPNNDWSSYAGAESSELPNNVEEPSSTSGESSFDDLLADFNQELYPGSTKFTKLSFILKIYHIKCMCGISDKGISMVLELLKEAFPSAKFPSTFSDMKRVIRKLGLTYETIHACPNNCMLFWDTNADREACEVCEESRWKASKKENSDEPHTKKRKKRIPAKVLRYFPLKPRLQRLYMSTKTASDMRWHATDGSNDGKLRHPKDGGAWKAFDRRFPEFASDPRNVRLGLATDGFNPFGTMSTNYSVWPVILFPYNLPPWISMNQTSMILSMIIPGKQMPGNDIDVYLQPLIKELKELWSEGIQTRDAFTKQNFTLRAAIMWTVSDFPGLGNLSGWNTYTALACPSCNYDAVEKRLHYGRKNCFMGHRRFLPLEHEFRKSRAAFDGSEEIRTPPIAPSGSTIKHQLERVNVTLGKRPESVGRKRDMSDMENSDGLQWKKKSIFFDLPYWEFLVLRHNLDVMHIEKNVFDNIVYTLLDDKTKSKDNLNARKDLQEMGIRPELWPTIDGKYTPARFTLDNKGKDIFLNVLKNVKLPDGYGSNISRCVDMKNRKLFGLKSHDCYLIMRDLLPIAVRNLLPQDVTSVIIEFSKFFRDVTSKVLDSSELDKLQERIVMTLCHLEMIFPPPFFTVMVHLTVHLVEEAKQGGPVVFRWMYPIERTLGYFKTYVRNRAKPEGSICEQYLADECVTFCSMYLDDIETRFNRVGRVDDRPTVVQTQALNTGLQSRFPNIGRFVGAGHVYTLSCLERQQAHRLILINCQFLDQLRERYRNELGKRQSRQRKRSLVMDIDRELHLNFGKWLKEKVEKKDIEEISDDLRCIALGPSEKAVKYLAYNVNGFKFRGIARDDDLKTQNSGVYVNAKTVSYASSHDQNPRAGDLAYYGKLIEVIELNYYDTFKVVLFKCKWADTRNNRGYKHDDYGHSMVNFSRLLHTGDDDEDEPYILASQAKMVYYVEDPCENGWDIAVHVQPRDLYDMGD